MEEVINFHGNPIYKTNINYFLSDKEKQYISTLDYRNANDTGNNNFISINVNILNSNLCNNLASLFNSYTDYYIKNILEIDHKLKRLNSWVTINKKEGFHLLHYHPNTFISICFYPQIEKGGISFYNKPPIESNTNLSFNKTQINVFNSDFYSMKLSSRDLLIFPGWLQHAGEINNSDVDRIMIGANYFISDKLGTPESVDELHLI
jgi:uncharacterized protein (TIGR02466 family)